MAATTRSAKSGSDWTMNELLAYNIVVSSEPAALFFGSEPSAALDDIDPAFVHHAIGEDIDNVSDNTFYLLKYLDLASRANAGQQSAVGDFSRELLRTLGFQRRPAVIRARYAIPFIISGETKIAQTGLCLLNSDSTILFLLHEDTTPLSAKNPEPQLIAEAIAAFQYNNVTRTQLGLPTLDEMEFPCMTMVGARPTFYKIPVTSALSKAVITATYPAHATCVTRCVVPSRRLMEGMESKVFRTPALQYLLAFKDSARQFETYLGKS